MKRICRTLFQLSLMLCLLWHCASPKKLYPVVGGSGEGKSTTTNLLVGHQVAEESEGMDSCTKTTAVYPIQPFTPASGLPVLGEHTLIMDTPGFHDTNGLTLEEITTLMRMELLKQEVERIQGVLLVVDGSKTRLNVLRNLDLTLQMLGPDVLPYVTVVISKAGLPRAGGTSSEVLAVARKSFASAGGNPEKVVMVDLKSLIVVGEAGNVHPVQAIAKALAKGPQDGYGLAGMEELARREKDYLAQELASEANWVTTAEKVPRVVVTTKQTEVMVNVPYHYQCDCHKVCKVKVLGVCVDRKTVCGTCAGTRQEPRWVSEQVHETVYDTVTTRRLLNSEEFYQRKAKERVSRELHHSVFGNKNAV
ncbi:hypothetical protein QOT17_014475 [Balamuthia mandrillaris]